MVPPPHTSSGHQKIRGSGAGAKCGAPRFAPFGRTSPGTGFGGPQRGSQYLFMQLRDDAHPVDSGSEVQVQPCSRRRESRQATCSKVIDRITRSTTSPCLPALRKGDTQHSALSGRTDRRTRHTACPIRGVHAWRTHLPRQARSISYSLRIDEDHDPAEQPPSFLPSSVSGSRR
jgi:hypothetical protein